jgi:hypothetical protein
MSFYEIPLKQRFPVFLKEALGCSEKAFSKKLMALD